MRPRYTHIQGNATCRLRGTFVSCTWDISFSFCRPKRKKRQRQARPNGLLSVCLSFCFICLSGLRDGAGPHSSPRPAIQLSAPVVRLH